MTVLKIERLPHNKFLPEYKTEGSAGMDLCAAIAEPIMLKPLERADLVQACLSSMELL